MATKKFSEYAIEGQNVTLTYDNVNDTVTFDVVVDKNNVGLGNVDNTSDANKPISNATQTALNDKASTTSLNAHTSDLNNPHAVTKTQVGLGNVDNTSDVNKPISSATQTALNGKQDTLVSGTNIKTVNSNSLLGSGDVVIDKSSVGLGNVANVDTTNASNITSGTLGDARLSTNVTTQGNTFNAANKLVQLDGTAKLPAVDGSQLTNLPSFTPPNGLLKIASAISTTLQVVKDYLDNASVLFLNSRRVGIGKDTSVTTQSVAVIEVQDANTSIVLKPNGTGGIIASVPDGTATSGNARGSAAIDFQMGRDNAIQVASGEQSIIAGGRANRASGLRSAIVGGEYGVASGSWSYVGGGNVNTASASYSGVSSGSGNNASSNYSTISGGQSNTASTNTHATVVGGQSNTASGQHSVSGGNGSIASGQFSTAFGKGRATDIGATASGGWSSGYPTASGTYSTAFGQNTTASGSQSFAVGGSGTIANALGSAAIGSDVASTKEYAFAVGSLSGAYLYGQNASASGRFSFQGDAQQSLITARKSDTLTTAATTVLSLDGTGTTNLIIPSGNNRAWNVQIDTIAVITAITGTATGVSVGDCYREAKQLLFKRIGGTSSIVGTVDTSAIKSDTSMSTAALTVTAGASQQMAITFTGPSFAGGGSVTCRVVSKVSLVEVAY